MNEEVENKQYRHISEKKKKSISVKKITRILFFIIVVAFFAILSHRVTRLILIKRNERLFRDIFAKVEEDSKVQNFYEKKIWDGDITRETWRKDNNYLIVDTSQDGKVTKEYYYEGKYYVLSESVDAITFQTSKKAAIVSNVENDPPCLGLQKVEVKDETIKELAEMTTVKSVKVEDTDCYQVYMKNRNDIYYMRKSDNRVIRQIAYKKDGDTGEIIKYDSGVIEVRENSVTDADVAVPDLTDYHIEEYDADKVIEEKYGIKKSSEDNS